MLPTGVGAYLEQLRAYGFSKRWVALQSDLWVLVFATHPETAAQLFHDQAQILAEPALRQIFLDYDDAFDLDPEDPFIQVLADRAVAVTHDRYDLDKLPGQDITSDIPTLIQTAVNASSPAWQRVDTLIRQLLHRPSTDPGSD